MFKKSDLVAHGIVQLNENSNTFLSNDDQFLYLVVGACYYFNKIHA